MSKTKTNIIEKIKNFALETIPEQDKCEAHKKTDERAKAYTEAIASPLIKLKEAELKTDNKLKKAGFKVAAATYKVVAGFAVNPETLSDSKKDMYKMQSLVTKEHQSFGGKWKEATQGQHPIKDKTNLVLKNAVKLPLKMTVDALQFTVRNTVKQPLVTAFRAGALVNNSVKYAAAKIRGDSTKAQEEAKNVKYQAGQFAKGAVATAGMLLIDSAIIGSAGVAAPITGIAGAAIGHAAEAAHIHIVADTTHFSSLGKGGVDVATKTLGVELGHKEAVDAAKKIAQTTKNTMNNALSSVSEKTKKISNNLIKTLSSKSSSSKIHPEISLNNSLSKTHSRSTQSR